MSMNRSSFRFPPTSRLPAVMKSATYRCDQSIGIGLSPPRAERSVCSLSRAVMHVRGPHGTSRLTFSAWPLMNVHTWLTVATGTLIPQSHTWNVMHRLSGVTTVDESSTETMISLSELTLTVCSHVVAESQSSVAVQVI